jgi:transcriptional regulator with XRE-family HTH domain
MDARIDPRIVDIVGRMHVARITGQALAKESGYNASYVSEVLNGKRGSEKTIQNILDALSRLEAKQQTEEQEVRA